MSDEAAVIVSIDNKVPLLLTYTWGISKCVPAKISEDWF